MNALLSVTQQIVDRYEQKFSQKGTPSKSLLTFLDAFSKGKATVVFETDAVYAKFLAVVNKETDSHRDLYKKVLSSFKIAFGLPSNDFDRSVKLVSKDGTECFCSKELLEAIVASDFFSSMLNCGWKESKQENGSHVIHLNLSAEALTFFHQYLYEKSSEDTLFKPKNFESLQQLEDFAQMIQDRKLCYFVVASKYAFFCRPENDSLFDPDLFSCKQKETFARFFLTKSIKSTLSFSQIFKTERHTMLGSSCYRISLSAFQRIFKDDTSNVQKFLIQKISGIVSDIPPTPSLLLLPKIFRNAITRYSEGESKIFDKKSLLLTPSVLPPEVRMIFPNAATHLEPGVLERMTTVLQVTSNLNRNFIPENIDAMYLWLAHHSQECRFLNEREKTSPEQLARKVLTRSPDNVAAHIVLGDIATATGTKLQTDPNKSADAHALYLQALTQYQKALTLDPQNNLANIKLIDTLYHLVRFKEAKAECRKLISQHPKQPEYHSHLGTFLMHEGKLDKAHAELTKAVILAPYRLRVTDTIKIGSILRQKGDLAGAEKTFRFLIATYEECSMAHAGLAAVFRDQGKLEEALQAYRQAVLLDPQNHFAKRHLEILEKKMKNS